MPSPEDLANNMFHTFQGLAPPTSTSEITNDAPKATANGAPKRITTPHACAECKRRKIRCDGRQPCGQCVGCRSPKPCYYDKHRQRVIPSRKTLDALQQSLDECRSILKRLFPARDPQSLVSLSRRELIALIEGGGSATADESSPTVSHHSATTQEYHSPLASISPDDGSLANLEQVPSRDTEWDEERRNRDPIPAESDDVNALSLSVDRQTSYLGASSVKAAFIVMLKVAPALRPYLESPALTSRIEERSNYPTPRPGFTTSRTQRIPWSSEGQTLIDAYFNRVQIFVPMLDEPSFRANYLGGQRNDGPWLAILNMVFAMGSIVALKSDDHSHINFYNRAKEHLPLDSFGSGHIETLQALALMGGYYLHYINRPNMANAIIGAAMRMATALGLHRESLSPVVNGKMGDEAALETELRRRTWWSLFCMDTWASTPMGRPSHGRWGQAITIRPPENANETGENSTTGQHIRIVPLIENIKFCKISTAIQDTLALCPLPSNTDRNVLDNKLVEWSENLPFILRSTEPCPEALYTARCVMKWRYQNLRIVLHRPVLLHLAYRGNGVVAGKDELSAVETCRALAKQTINDITREWARNQMSGWNAVWFLYQASMIPLVSIFWESWDVVRVREWQNQIETVLDGLEALSDWSLAARRSREVVAKMYEASKGPITRQGSPRLMPVQGAMMPNGDSSLNGSAAVNGNAMHLDMIPGQVQSQTHGEQMTGQEMMHQMQDGMNMLENLENQSIWDLDGMQWGTILPEMDLPYDRGLEVEYNLMNNGGNDMRGWHGDGHLGGGGSNGSGGF